MGSQNTFYMLSSIPEYPKRMVPRVWPGKQSLSLFMPICVCITKVAKAKNPPTPVYHKHWLILFLHPCPLVSFRQKKNINKKFLQVDFPVIIIITSLFLRIRPGEEITRNYDPGQTAKEKPPSARKAQELAKYAHAVIFVMKAKDPRLKDGKYKDTLKKIREHFSADGKENIFAVPR